jgi:uncharacterized protein
MWKAHTMPSTQVLASLPVLPLPSVVLVPGMLLPLNIHEPAALELVDFVRARGRYLGVPLLLPAGELAPVFALARLVSHVHVTDHRRVVRLEGVGRVRALRELPRSHRFRELAVSPLAEPYPTHEATIAALRAHIEHITDRCGEDGEGLLSLLHIADERMFLYSLTAFLPSLELLVHDDPGDESVEVEADERALARLQQQSLAAPTADERAEFLVRRIDEIVARLGRQLHGALLN